MKYIIAGVATTQAAHLLSQGPFNPRSVEHCPDFDERYTLNDGRTRAVAYPAKGWNCNPEWSLSEVEAPRYPGADFKPGNVEHCPDFDERFTLKNGRTRAIPYPNRGWNCHNGLGLSEIELDAPRYPGADFKPGNVEHCPDFDERFTLKNGRTRAIPYPNKGWNCHNGLGLSEIELDAPRFPGADFNPGNVEHCPDFDERFTLKNGRTLAIPYPKKGWNCHRGLGLAEVEGPFNPRSVEHCPDFDERFTLNDGRTRAVPYPRSGWNCNPEWSLLQEEMEAPPAKKAPAKAPAAKAPAKAAGAKKGKKGPAKLPNF